MRSFVRTFLLFPILLLTGCFMVGDFGEYWKKGTIDPVLEGTWTDILSRKSETLVRHGDRYNYANIKDTTSLKTLTIGDTTFLMMQSVTSKALIRYSATKDRMVIYGPNPLKRKEFMDKFSRDSNLMINDKGITIKVLNANTLKLLEHLSEDKDYWIEKVILEKGTGLTDEILEQEKNFKAPDPFSDAREKYKNVIGKEKGKPIDVPVPELAPDGLPMPDKLLPRSEPKPKP